MESTVKILPIFANLGNGKLKISVESDTVYIQTDDYTINHVKESIRITFTRAQARTIAKILLKFSA